MFECGNTIWPIMPIIMFILFVIFIFLLCRYFKCSYPNKPETPLDIINSRYAKGEISREEYEQMKQDLLKK